MAGLPGSDMTSLPSGDVGNWLWPVLLDTLLESEQKDGLAAPAPAGFAGSGQTGESSAAAGSHGVGQWEPLIRETARRYSLDPALLEAIMIAESAGNPEARSPAGALGLMQLMPATARALGVNPLNPAENLDGGARYLQSLIARFHGDLTKAVAAYNAGPGAVEKYGGVPPYRETQEYVRRVSELYSQFRNRSLG
ncbi:MAG: lytic transglycosylase domain-containing protein [Alicyclobacillaceae bacterium]|nr:lytic transglycosylase domain-containing protein [Alicyclobacillaceae bacterium]